MWYHEERFLFPFSLDYFQRYGINPAKHESPAKEMEKLIKKNDQVIGFIRKQEQDILRPMLEAITTTEEKNKRLISGVLATSDKLIEFIQAVDSNSNIQVDTRDKLAETISKQNKEVKQAILTLARYLDEKGKAGLIDRLFG